MKRDDFLPDLKEAFREWRAGKASRNEAIPGDLLETAMAAGAKYGSKRVARALKLEPKRLEAREPEAAPRKRKTAAVAREMPKETPTFSRIQVSFPRGPQSAAPLLEAETPVGVKLRVFAMTPETINVLSSFCRGGAP